ncbi:MAG: hypothetical protein ACXVJX_18490 [Acidimicrobiia bacterium]
MSADEQVRLSIPASAEYLRLARLAVADVGARAGFAYEDIDDLRIAIDELCYAIGAGDDGARLDLVYAICPGRVEVDGTTDRPAAEEPGEIAAAIIAAVVDSYTITTSDGRGRFHFVKTAPGT